MCYLEKSNIQSMYHRNVHLKQTILLNSVTAVSLIKFEKKTQTTRFKNGGIKGKGKKKLPYIKSMPQV